MQDLFPQPDQADEGQQGQRDNSTALQDVRHDVLCAEDIDGQTEDGGDTASEESPVDSTSCEGDDAEPGNRDEGVVQPELDRPVQGEHDAQHHKG